MRGGGRRRFWFLGNRAFSVISWEKLYEIRIRLYLGYTQSSRLYPLNDRLISLNFRPLSPKI